MKFKFFSWTSMIFFMIMKNVWISMIFFNSCGYPVNDNWTIEKKLQQNSNLIQNRSNIKGGNTLDCLDQYTCSELSVKQSGLYNSLGIQVRVEDGDGETARPVKQSRCSWLSGGYVAVIYFLKCWNQKFWLLKLNFTLKVMVNHLPKQ